MKRTQTHREDDSNSAYHVPGWPSPATPPQFQIPKDWDAKENAVINYIRHASFSINGESIPQHYPIPTSPAVWLDSQSGARIRWRGSAWANSYELWVASSKHVQPNDWRCLAKGVLDAAGPGECGYQIPPDVKGSSLKMRGIGVDGGLGEWSTTIDV